MIPTNYQNALLENLSGDELKNMQSAIKNNLFYAAAVDTVCGGLTLGLIEADELDIPCLFSTKEEAEESLRDEIERYQEEINSGERDEDDKPEEFLCVVRWNEDGENIDIYSDLTSNLIETKSPKMAAGG